MIYTVTFNPSLDYIVGVDDFRLGATNRTSYEQMLAGGKGINVSYVLKNLGFESTAFGRLCRRGNQTEGCGRWHPCGFSDTFRGSIPNQCETEKH